MNRFSIKKLRIVFLFFICIVFANAVISYSNTIKLNINQQSVNNSYKAIVQIERTLSAFKDVQIAREAYFLSTDENNLKAYMSAWIKIDENIQSLKNITEDNFQYIDRILLLEKTINNRLNDFRKYLYSNSETRLGLSEDVALINEIKTLIDSIKTKENKILLDKINQSQINYQKAITAFLIAGSINLGLVSQLYYRLKNYILKLKKTENALRQSENRLRAIIDAEPESIKLIQKDGTLLEINTSGIVMMEVENADILIGKSIYLTITPEYQKKYRLMHESVCRGNKETLEFEKNGYKGTRLWKETNAVP